MDPSLIFMTGVSTAEREAKAPQRERGIREGEESVKGRQLLNELN